MYFTFSDTQPCILNNNVIIAEVAVKWNKKNNEISTKMAGKVFHAHEMWITHLNFTVNVFINAEA